METLTLSDIRGEFECNRVLDRFNEQDLKIESFGNLGLIYTLFVTPSLPNFCQKIISFQFLGSMLPQYMALSVCFVSSKTLLQHRATSLDAVRRS